MENERIQKEEWGSVWCLTIEVCSFTMFQFPSLMSNAYALMYCKLPCSSNPVSG